MSKEIAEMTVLLLLVWMLLNIDLVASYLNIQHLYFSRKQIEIDYVSLTDHVTTKWPGGKKKK